MLHKFLEPGDWFAPKRFGYGAGLPVAWQGWVLLAVYVGLIAGLALWAGRGDGREAPLAYAGMAGATLALILIARRRTRGGWRWRQGEDD